MTRHHHQYQSDLITNNHLSNSVFSIFTVCVCVQRCYHILLRTILFLYVSWLYSFYQSRDREYSHYVIFFKGQAVTAASASIPSSYQTVVIDSSERRGFNSQSKRFSYDLTSVCTTMNNYKLVLTASSLGCEMLRVIVI